jgi:hypothetical protein
LSILLLYLKGVARVLEKDIVVDPAVLLQARKELSMLDVVRIKPVCKGFVHPLSSTASGYWGQRPYTSRLKATALGPMTALGSIIL